jgi:hypothetical protein
MDGDAVVFNCEFEIAQVLLHCLLALMSVSFVVGVLVVYWPTNSLKDYKKIFLLFCFSSL